MFGQAGSLAVKDGVFTDKLEGYGTRAYEIINVAAPTDEVVQIELSLAPDPVEAQAGPGPSANLVRNGGFETDAAWVGVKPEGPAFLDTSSAFAGMRSLCLRHDAGTPSVSVRLANLDLEPNKRYELSARLRGEFASGPSAWGGPTISVWSLASNKTLVYLQTHMKSLGEWYQRKGSFRTGAEKETVQVALIAEARKYIGAAWIDDVVLREVRNCETRNLMRNSSFEHATLPHWPDRWGSLFDTVTLDELCGGRNALFTQDDREAVDGSYSLRLRGFHQMASMPGRPDRGVVLAQGEPYVFSVYMKTDTEGKNVWLGGYDMGWTRFTLTKEWKRYHLTADPAVVNARRCLHMGIRTMWAGKADELPGATVWLDAAQFEQGTEPTEYVRDVYAPGDRAWMRAETPN